MKFMGVLINPVSIRSRFRVPYLPKKMMNANTPAKAGKTIGKRIRAVKTVLPQCLYLAKMYARGIPNKVVVRSTSVLSSKVFPKVLR
jgi:hypothetical protein